MARGLLNPRFIANWRLASLVRSVLKNGTDGTIKVAIDAINAAGAPHCFLSVTKWGHSAIVNTSGNGDCHIILRGGKAPKL
ncbi:Phospho-2-dehydro-3-deoxyheptonate aldolase [Salmonella enterica subsp. enterica]|uniref:3-deoxy-7-phosphoheptulonate synthase n=1 Tax=Salmonella enterica I TaxID=59201 RepID=A0A3S4M056_SALET|nr:Phospho-2-dehydro-3-deoxyheptonate aldolase [Salmonella enterica subsp. enterica]